GFDHLEAEPGAVVGERELRARSTPAGTRGQAQPDSPEVVRAPKAFRVIAIEQDLVAAERRVTRVARSGKKSSMLLARPLGGAERPGAVSGLDHPGRPGPARDESIALEKVVGPRLNAGRIFGNQEAARAQDPSAQNFVFARVGNIGSGSEHRDRRQAG